MRRLRGPLPVALIATALGCRRPTTESIERVVETAGDAAEDARAQTGDAGARPDARLVVDGKRLVALGLTMGRVRGALAGAKIEVVRTKGADVEELYLRLGAASLTEVMKLELGTASGVPVRLSDVATLEMIAGGY